MTGPLEAMANRARREPYFLGFLLERYAVVEKLDDAALATALRCSPADLTDARLCRSPRFDQPEFRDDIQRIAEACHLDPMQLMHIVKRAVLLDRFPEQSAHAESVGLLMAARDREEAE